MKNILILLLLLIGLSCSKEDCQTCTKTIGGFAGNITMEEKMVCNNNEIEKLEASSSGTTVWACE